MAVDLNVAAPEDEDDDPPGHLPGGQDLQLSVGDRHQGAGHGPPSFDLNLAAYESVDEVDGFNASFDLNLAAYESDEVAGFNAPAEAGRYDLNIDLEQEEAGEDADVYATDFHVIFEEEELQGSNDQLHREQDNVFNAPAEAATFDLNYPLEEDELQWSIDEAHVQQGSQTQNANVVIKRKNLSDEERQQIYEALLLRSVNGKLKKRTTRIVATLFNVNRYYVQSIWRKAKKCRAAGLPVDVTSKRKKNCGRKKAAIDLSRIATIPLEKRTTLRALADELGVKKSTLHRLFKQGKIRRHSNTLKPYLRDDSKMARLQYCVSMLHGTTLENQPKFIDMKNIIHIDEKWFNTTKKAQKFYMLPEEEDPLRTIHNKNAIPKCMLLCAVAPPRYDDAGTCYFDGKLGIWPFVRQVNQHKEEAEIEKRVLESRL
ncbi:hypothetical protein ACP70R_032492 [Stipagrostis hirtigluma subsp. patula]